MKKSKFNNIKVEIDGITFDSKREAERYKDLVLLQRAGIINNLLLQQNFDLAPSAIIQGRKRPPLRYKADFTYFDNRKSGGGFTVEDVKGFRTEAYRIKRHLMMTEHNIEVLET